jgi:hypothetical protein
MKKLKIISYLVENDSLIVCNPCVIPMNQIEKTIKEYKQRKDKNTCIVTGYIEIPFEDKNISGSIKRTLIKSIK